MSNGIDTLTPVAVKTVIAKNLREGAILVDEFDCPAAVIDHRMKSTRGSGEAAFLVEDLDNGGWIRQSFHANARVRIAA